jgi:hypothetical protein
MEETARRAALTLADQVGRDRAAELLGVHVRQINRFRTREAKVSLANLSALLAGLKKDGTINIYDLIDEEGIDVLASEGVGFIEFKEFPDRDAYYDYMADMESQGRMVVLTRFPSAIYHFEPSSAPEKRRLANIRKGGLFNMEFYPVKALIDFGFSPSWSCSCEEKIAILERLDAVFAEARSKMLCFFSDHDARIPAHSEIEVLKQKGFLILQIPSFDHAALVIKNPHLAKWLYKRFDSHDFNGHSHHQINNKDAQKVVLCLKEALRYGDGFEGLKRFCELCASETSSAELIVSNLSPSMRRLVLE